MDISKRFNSEFDCTQLAVYLKIENGSDFISSLRAVDPRITSMGIAFEVMKQWQREFAETPESSGAFLYKVLKIDLRNKALAESFKDVLHEGKQLDVDPQSSTILIAHVSLCFRTTTAEPRGFQKIHSNFQVFGTLIFR